MVGRTVVLLLAGSAEAIALARWLATREDVRLLVSLKGATRAPARLPGEPIVGGFGGGLGLCRFLRERGVALVVDATHPFATRIARNARRAALVAAVQHVKLWRPPWRPSPADRWHDAGDAADAARVASSLGARPFVGLGAGGVRHFPTAGFAEVTFRGIEPPLDLPPNARFVRGRAPFTLADEVALLRTIGADVVVTKNAGGDAAFAKLAAARALGLPVVMMRRPPQPPPPLVDDAATARASIARFLDDRTSGDALRAGFPPVDTAKRPRH